MVLIDVSSKIAGHVFNQQLKKAGKQSIELFGYNFINLMLMLMLYYILALVIAKYFEAILFGKGIINDILKFIGFVPVFPENDFVVKLFSTGFGDQKIVYWDIIKGISVILVIIEWKRFNDTQKALDGKTSVMTHSVFALIVGLLTLMTIPKIFQTIRSVNEMEGIKV